MSTLEQLRRAGLWIIEAFSLDETDVDRDREVVPVRHGKGDKRREVEMHRTKPLRVSA